MGGHASGAAASRMVIDQLGRAPTGDDLDHRVELVLAALDEANDQLIDLAKNSGQGIIGSTVALLLTQEDRGAVVWVGDSRIYRHRDGQLTQLTRDHSQLEEMAERGWIDRTRAKNHPSSNVLTRAIGAAANLEPSVESIAVLPGDTYLICSDGLYNEIGQPDLVSALAAVDCADGVRTLLELTLNTPARDNVSLIIIKISAGQGDKTLINPVVSDRRSDRG